MQYFPGRKKETKTMKQTKENRDGERCKKDRPEEEEGRLFSKVSTV